MHIEDLSVTRRHSRSATLNDIDRIIAFNVRIFRPAVGAWARELLAGTHPTVSVSDFSIVEDPATGNIVSSLCLIHQHWLFEGIRLNVGQIELVGTDECHRGQGLIRRQMDWFAKKLEERQCQLACVQGVPTLYQRLGYYFAIPLKGGVRLRLDHIPTERFPADYRIRLCSQDDFPRLSELFEQSIQSLAIRSERDIALWTYQENQSRESEHAYETYTLEQFGKIIGYVRLSRHTKQDAIVVRELAVSSYDDLLVILSFTRELAIARQLTSVILQLAVSHRAMEAVRYCGAEVIPAFAWQVRVIDWIPFFEALVPVLERRLAHSLMWNYSGDVLILVEDHQRILRFVFHNGKAARIEREEASSYWHARVTDQILTQLAFGYRNRSELESWHLEMQTQPDARYIFDVLFPKVETFVYEVY